MVLEGITAKVIFEQRLEGRRRLSHVENWAVCYSHQGHKRKSPVSLGVKKIFPAEGQPREKG